MISSHLQIGSLGEQLACDLLSSKGYRVIERNFRSKYGEIDLIAIKDDIYVFVEVKCRVGNRKGKPYEAVNKPKLFKIQETAQLYVLQKKLKKYKLSVHVVSIELNEDLSVKECKHFENVQL